jgi:hypothetical protein
MLKHQRLLKMPGPCSVILINTTVDSMHMDIGAFSHRLCQHMSTASFSHFYRIRHVENMGCKIARSQQVHISNPIN